MKKYSGEHRIGIERGAYNKIGRGLTRLTQEKLKNWNIKIEQNGGFQNISKMEQRNWLQNLNEAVIEFSLRNAWICMYSRFFGENRDLTESEDM